MLTKVFYLVAVVSASAFMRAILDAPKSWKTRSFESLDNVLICIGALAICWILTLIVGGESIFGMSRNYYVLVGAAIVTTLALHIIGEPDEKAQPVLHRVKTLIQSVGTTLMLALIFAK